jgi:hypothetical protein
MRKIILAAVTMLAASPFQSALAAPTPAASLSDNARSLIKARFEKVMALANRHDIAGLHNMFWQSPSTLLVAKSAVASEGNWAGYWGNDAIDRKLHDIAAAGPAILQPDLMKFKVVGITRDVAQSYDPVTITVSYAGQDGTPKPFLVIMTWLKVGNDWKIATEVLLPVPPAPAAKG